MKDEQTLRPFFEFGSMFKFRFVLWWIVLSGLLVACGGEATAVPPTPTLSPAAVAGKQVFTRVCGSCHSTTPDTTIVGPSLAGIATRAEARVPGQDARTYIMTSIMRPQAYLVEGFEPLMPEDFGKSLTGEEIDNLVAYLLTLQEP